MKPNRSTEGRWPFGKRCPEPLEVATVLSNLARLCLDQEKYDEVELLSKRALAISQSLAPKHPEVAHSLNNLADVHAIQGRYAQAEPLYRQALTILEEAFGPEHPEVAYALNHLAKLSLARPAMPKLRPCIAGPSPSSREPQGNRILLLPVV